MPQNRLLTLLAGRPAIFDGGYGWLLQDRGLPAGEAAESWNLENPAGIEELHEEYAAAGARFLTTNTFGGSRPRLELHGLGDRVEEVNRAGAQIARRVADRHGALVAGDLGPTGELLEPLGILSEADASALFAEQLRGLAAGGIDVVLIETMSDLGETRAAISAAHDVVPDLPVIATMSFDTNRRTMMGVDPATAVAELAAAGVDAVGANCGRGPEDMSVIAEQLTAARHDDVLVIAQSNAGLPELRGGEFVYTVDPVGMAEHARELRELGVDVIGACCGSSPEHIRAITEALTR
ncbi:Homocysteine S-methyltransferase (fragment) [Nostocoides japonicum T1-X7]|uniref:Homocysteine S-methyltransferase n=1 Tax=Nostocoides japonicum T1-X7 TaxID=1194083 RepID=A0A077M339_9MICO